VDEAVDGGGSDGEDRRTDLRVRLPRRELRTGGYSVQALAPKSGKRPRTPRRSAG